MKIFLTLLLCLLYNCKPNIDNSAVEKEIIFYNLINSDSSTQNWEWIQTLGAKTTSGTQINRGAVIIDSSDNSYSTGYTLGNIDDQTKTGIYDAFITKYDTDGNKQWLNLLGVSDSKTYSYDVTLDNSDYVYIIGSTDGNLDGQTLTGELDTFIVKYDTNGSKQWTKLLGTKHDFFSEYGNTYGYAIASDNSGNIYVTGSVDINGYSGDLDGIPLTGNSDVYVVKYDTNGNKQWTKLLGVSNEDSYGNDVLFDGSSYVYVTGNTSGNLDGETLTGYRDMFIVQYDLTGNKQWTKLIGVTNSITIGSKLAIGGNANSIYIFGCTKGNIDGESSTGSFGNFIAKYDSSGNRQWLKMLGEVASSSVNFSCSNLSNGDIAIDGEENVWVTGATEVSIDDQTITSDTDTYLMKYNSNGDKQGNATLIAAEETDSSSSYSSSDEESNQSGTEPFGLKIDSNSNIIISGNTTGNLLNQKLIGSKDFFIAKFKSESLVSE